MNLKEIGKEAYENGEAKGFNHKQPIPSVLCLIHSEISEALEDYRNDDMKLYHTPDKDGNLKPEGFSIEMADIIIRVCDTCERLDIDLEKHVRMKMDYNKKRPYKHGGKKI